jgi:hypothetical protein
MSKRYLRQLRADMACVEKLQVATPPSRASFAFRIWPDHGSPTALAAFLDGLARAERRTEVRERKARVVTLRLPLPAGWPTGCVASCASGPTSPSASTGTS